MEVARNVYFRDRRAALPSVEDVVLIYESETATVKGKAVKRARLHHRGRREMVELPKGRGRVGLRPRGWENQRGL